MYFVQTIEKNVAKNSLIVSLYSTSKFYKNYLFDTKDIYFIEILYDLDQT